MILRPLLELLRLLLLLLNHGGGRGRDGLGLERGHGVKEGRAHDCAGSVEVHWHHIDQLLVLLNWGGSDPLSNQLGTAGLVGGDRAVVEHLGRGDGQEAGENGLGKTNEKKIKKIGISQVVRTFLTVSQGPNPYLWYCPSYH